MGPDVDVYDWLGEVFDCLLIQPMTLSVGFSFLTRHPTTGELRYMYAAQELAYASTKIRTKVK